MSYRLWRNQWPSLRKMNRGTKRPNGWTEKNSCVESSVVENVAAWWCDTFTKVRLVSQQHVTLAVNQVTPNKEGGFIQNSERKKHEAGSVLLQQRSSRLVSSAIDLYWAAPTQSSLNVYSLIVSFSIQHLFQHSALLKLLGDSLLVNNLCKSVTWIMKLCSLLKKSFKKTVKQTMWN